MSINIRIFMFIVGTFMFIMILELVRKRKFREELSVIWLILGVGLVLSSFVDFIINPIAERLGVYYPPTFIMLLMAFFSVFVFLYFSITVSDLKTKNIELIQKIALMEYRLNNIDRKTDLS